MASTTPTVTREIPAVLTDMIGGSVIVPDTVTERSVKATIVSIEPTRIGYHIFGKFRPTFHAPLGELNLDVKDSANRVDDTGIEMYCIITGRPVRLRRS